MKQKQPLTYLFLGAHPDDISLGCGGLIAKLQRTNTCVTPYFAVLSVKNKNADGDVILERDLIEPQQAAHILGYSTESVNFGPFFGQVFHEQAQAIREYLLTLRAKYIPDRVFFPSLQDIHQDHQVLAQEAFRIFRNSDCFGYEIIRSSLQFCPNYYVMLSKEDVEIKISAVSAFRSQKTQSAGYYFDAGITKSTLIYHGTKRGCEFAEAYEIYSLGE